MKKILHSAYMMGLLFCFSQVSYARNKGIENIGKKEHGAYKDESVSCYLNATIQCLSYLKSFNDYLKENKEHYKKDEATTKSLIVPLYLEILDQLKADETSGDHLAIKEEGPLKKFILTTAGNYFLGGSKVPEVKDLKQEDAAEFLEKFLGSCLQEHADYKTLDKYKEEGDGFLGDNSFSVLVASWLNNFFKKEPSFEIIGESMDFSRIKKFLRLFSIFKDVKEDEGYQQPYIIRLNLTTKKDSVLVNVSEEIATQYKSLLYYPPKLLMVNLLAYNDDGTKKKVHYDYPDILDLTKNECLGKEVREFLTHHSSISLQYILKGVMVHYGNKLTSGHYTAYCSDNSDSEKPLWFLYDDHKVREEKEIKDKKEHTGNHLYDISTTTTITAPITPIILFYELKDQASLNSFDPANPINPSAPPKADKKESDKKDPLNTSLMHLKEALKKLKEKLCGLLEQLPILLSLVDK